MATPIILCGKEGSLSGDVRAGLLPEYEVIAFIQGHAQAKEDIPKYIDQAKAIVVGRGFTEEVKSTIEDATGKKATWILPDESKPVESDTAEGLIARGKALLNQLSAAGTLGAGGVHYF